MKILNQMLLFIILLVLVGTASCTSVFEAFSDEAFSERAFNDSSVMNNQGEVDNQEDQAEGIPYQDSASDSASEGSGDRYEEDGFQDNPADQPRVQSPDVEIPAPIPSGSLAVFYTVHTGSDSESLPLLVQEVSPFGDDLGAYGKRITWDTDYYAVLATIPAVAQSYVLHKISSPSYATNIIYPITKNGKLYIFRDWNTRGSGDVKDVSVYDPISANLLQTISLYPSAAGTPAIAGDDLFYRTSTTFDLYDKRTSGGEVYVYRPGMAISVKLLEYGDSANQGSFYGVGNHLLSLRYDRGALFLREHDTMTGAVQRELLSIQAPPVYDVYPGETALYLVVRNDETSREVIMLRPDGTASTLFSVELDAGETDLMVDEEAGRVIIIPIKNTNRIGFDSVTIYDLETNELEENVPLGVFVGLKRPGSHGDQFLFLE